MTPDRTSIPFQVRAVAAIQVLFALWNFSYFLFVISSAPSGPALFFGPLALLKGLLALVIAYGLLSLREGWRRLVVIIAGCGVVILPLWFFGSVFIPRFGNLLSTISGIDSLFVIQLGVAAAFIMFLLTLHALTRPGTKIVFSTRKTGEPGATP